MSVFPCAPSPKCPDGSDPHVRRSRHHNLMERNLDVKIKSAFSATYCTPAVHTNPQDSVQVLWSLQLWHVVTFTEWCNKLHCCKLCAKSSALFCGSSRSLTRSLSSPSVILWLEESVLGKQSASLEADGCSSSLFQETLSSSTEYTAKLSGVSGTGCLSPWGTGRIADAIFGYTSVGFFFMDVLFWVGGTIQT